MKRKVVLVTGSSIGLGKSIIEKYASNNYDVVITYLTHKEEAEKLKQKLEQKHNIKALSAKVDVSNEQDIFALKDLIINTFGTLDILINNAAISIDTTFDMKTKENFRKILDTNLIGPFLVSRVFGDIMYENKKGNIINISSTNAIDTYYEYSLDYDASKSGLINLTHNLAHHYAPYVKINCVCPGWINTPMNKNLDKEFKKEEESKILLNRFAEPEEIASLVYFLTTDEASYINDSIIRIDGGKK